MASGDVKQLTSIAAPVDADHVLKVRAVFEGEGTSGGDWGSAYRSRLYVVQNSVRTYADYTAHQTARNSYAMEAQFALSKGHTITAGLRCDISGAVAFSYYNLTLSVEVLKR